MVGTIPGLVTLGCLRKLPEQPSGSKAYHTTLSVYQFTQAMSGTSAARNKRYSDQSPYIPVVNEVITLQHAIETCCLTS